MIKKGWVSFLCKICISFYVNEIVYFEKNFLNFSNVLGRLNFYYVFLWFFENVIKWIKVIMGIDRNIWNWFYLWI